ncbi:MAG: hypothetical protein PHC30_09540 [Lentisphaeria bacterium]|jgi:hypothetical protein|nr:hypothetical protein [Lentisphaeria bacterium]
MAKFEEKFRKLFANPIAKAGTGIMLEIKKKILFLARGVVEVNGRRVMVIGEGRLFRRQFYMEVMADGQERRQPGGDPEAGAASFAGIPGLSAGVEDL